MPLFTVPKFTEMETKLIGSLTFRQVVFILATIGVCFFIYKTLPRLLSLPLALIAGAFGLALTFFKVGEIPLYQVFLSSLKFFITPKTLFWGKGGKSSPFSLKEMEFKKEEKGEIKIKKDGKLKETLVKTITKK